MRAGGYLATQQLQRRYTKQGHDAHTWTRVCHRSLKTTRNDMESQKWQVSLQNTTDFCPFHRYVHSSSRFMTELLLQRMRSRALFSSISASPDLSCGHYIVLTLGGLVRSGRRTRNIYTSWSDPSYSLVPRPKRPQRGSLPVPRRDTGSDPHWGCLGLGTRLVISSRAKSLSCVVRHVV